MSLIHRVKRSDELPAMSNVALYFAPNSPEIPIGWVVPASSYNLFIFETIQKNDYKCKINVA